MGGQLGAWFATRKPIAKTLKNGLQLHSARREGVLAVKWIKIGLSKMNSLVDAKEGYAADLKSECTQHPSDAMLIQSSWSRRRIRIVTPVPKNKRSFTNKTGTTPRWHGFGTEIPLQEKYKNVKVYEGPSGLNEIKPPNLRNRVSERSSKEVLKRFLTGVALPSAFITKIFSNASKTPRRAQTNIIKNEKILGYYHYQTCWFLCSDLFGVIIKSYKSVWRNGLQILAVQQLCINTSGF